MSFKTPKGTTLPMLNLKGKDYLQVAHRLVWFREEHPDWTIHTKIEQLAADSAVVQALIIDREGVTLASAHKMETKVGFPDYIEKAETGAIGRALALCGYGTQFAPELDEGERLADSPTARPTRVSMDCPPAQDAAPQGGVTGTTTHDHHPQFGPPWPKPEDATAEWLEKLREAEGIEWNCPKCEKPVRYYVLRSGKPLFQCEFARNAILEAYRQKEQDNPVIKQLAKEHYRKDI